MLMPWILMAVTTLAGAVPEAREFTVAPTNGGFCCGFSLQSTAASHIRCQMFLPDDWDGRFWGFGNGGWAELDYFATVDPGSVEFEWNREPRRLRVAPYSDSRVDCVDVK